MGLMFPGLWEPSAQGRVHLQPSQTSPTTEKSIAVLKQAANSAGNALVSRGALNLVRVFARAEQADTRL